MAGKKALPWGDCEKNPVNDLIQHPALDFSSYQPGDVISIPQLTIDEFGHAKSIMLVAAIANAASRANLAWSVRRSDAGYCVKVSFSELSDIS